MLCTDLGRNRVILSACRALVLFLFPFCYPLSFALPSYPFCFGIRYCVSYPHVFKKKKERRKKKYRAPVQLPDQLRQSLILFRFVTTWYSSSSFLANNPVSVSSLFAFPGSEGQSGFLHTLEKRSTMKHASPDIPRRASGPLGFVSLVFSVRCRSGLRKTILSYSTIEPAYYYRTLPPRRAAD